MLILSQDRNEIVNLDNVIYIKTNKYSEECSGISCNSLNNLEIYLGEYETEERTKEVLQEIMGKYEFSCRMKYGVTTMLGLDNYFLYKMPKN